MKVVIEQVLSSLYQQFGASVVFSVLFMIVYMYAEKEGWRSVLKSFYRRIKTDKFYRLKVFIFLCSYDSISYFILQGVMTG